MGFHDLILGLYNKQVKQYGSDQFDTLEKKTQARSENFRGRNLSGSRGRAFEEGRGIERSICWNGSIAVFVHGPLFGRNSGSSAVTLKVV
jgi:hypothetical protein